MTLSTENHIKFLFTDGIAPNLVFFIPLIFIYFAVDFQTFLLIFILFFVISFSLVFYIHYEYYNINKRTKIENEVISNKNQKYFLKDAKKMIVHKSVNYDYADGIVRKPTFFEQYYFIELFFDADTKIILTCLLSKNIDEVIKQKNKNLEIERDGRIFSPFPNWDE